MPDGARGNKEPSPLERLVAAREAEKKVQRKKDTRFLASLALVAVVLVGGGVFAWLRLVPGSPPSRHHPRALAATKPAVTTTAQPGPTVSLPGLTSPLDVNRPPVDPFSGTPADHWADGAAGITIPAARAHGPYTAAQVRSAYETTRAMLVAGNLDWPTLRGGAPKACSSTAGAQCSTRDGYIHPDYPSGPPDTVQASGKPVNPYSLATPSAGAGCQNTTGT
jgi:hypothetical protein